MYNFKRELPIVPDSRLETNSIWNSAGLPSTEFGSNLPTLPNLASQYQNFAGLPNLPKPLSETEVPLECGINQNVNDFDDSSAPQFSVSRFLSQFSPELQGNTEVAQTLYTPEASSSTSPLTGASPLDTPETTGVPSLSPTPATNKDPGYFSESECSSNSSEKDTLSATFAKSLQLDSTVPYNAPAKSPVISKPSTESIPTPDSPNLAGLLNDDVLGVIPRYDPQSFDPQDFKFTGDESWKVIKKPGKEAVIVPDLVSPDSARNVTSDGSWSGASSPSLGSSWGAEAVKPTFAQSTKQQVCVFCRNNGEDASVYTTHTLMSTAGKVICPILYAYKCPICQATGDYAHTLKYCPMMPKGLNSTSTPANPTRVPNLARLPKTATFPKHLSTNARAAMSQSSSSGFKPPFQPSRVQRSFPIQQQQGSSSPDLNTIADLQEAAQKILMFTNQVMEAQQQQGCQKNTPSPPQVAQFLLKLDKNKPNVPGYSGNGTMTKNFFGLPSPAQNLSYDNPLGSNISSKLAELLSATSTTRQGFSTLPNPPLNFGVQDSDNMRGPSFNAKLQELLSCTDFNPSESSKYHVPQTSLPQMPQTNLPKMPQANVPKMSQTSFGAPSVSQSFNVSAPAFVPGFGASSSSAVEAQSVDNTASAEIFKMLGINKTTGSAVNFRNDDMNSNSQEPSQLNKENTLANILANIKEFENMRNG